MRRFKGQRWPLSVGRWPPDKVAPVSPAANAQWPTANAPKSYNLALNGYRGLCASLVFAFHLGSAGVVPWPSGSASVDALVFVWSSLAYGVEMFFMISGFVILGSLLRHESVASFLKDRVIRIFSAWVPTLCAVTLICGPLQMKMFADVNPLQAAGLFFANLLLLPPLLPVPLIHFGSWSLTYEWVFYIAAASGALVLHRYGMRSWAAIAWLFLCALFICLFPRAVFFVTGVLVFRHQAWFSARKQWLRHPWLSLLVFLIAWRFTEANKASLSDTLFDWLFDLRSIAALVAFVASVHLFASICTKASASFHFLESRAMQFLGTVSYSFYLWHALVIATVKRPVISYIKPHIGAWPAFLLFALTSGALAIAMAYSSWWLFETKLAQLLRHRFSSTLAPRNSLHAA